MHKLFNPNTDNRDLKYLIQTGLIRNLIAFFPDEEYDSLYELVITSTEEEFDTLVAKIMN